MNFQGSKFTWNKCSVFERLDWALCNHAWDCLLPNTVVCHLHKLKSDYRPLGITFGVSKQSKTPRPFRFLSCWLSHSDFGNLVSQNWSGGDSLERSISCFVDTAKRWNKVVFGNLIAKKRNLIARIGSIQRAVENFRSNKLINLE